MGTGIYVKRKGVEVELTSKQVKSTIMAGFGFTDTKEYQKFYDIQRNKIRAFEAITGAKKQSVAKVLYKTAKSRIFYGEEYKPSFTQTRIQRMQSVSSGKALQKLTSNELYMEAQRQMYTQETKDRFEAFMNKNPRAQEIFDAISDPYKREKALSDYANKVHAELDARYKATGKASVPEKAEIVGSDLEVNFDISDYLKEE